MNADFYPKVENELFGVTLSGQEVKSYYDNWSEKYDKDVLEALKAPMMAAKTAAALFGSDVRSNVKILDVGAGTGLVGEELRKHGFQLIDALDPSDGMLEKAKKKNLYTNYICEFLTKDSLQGSNGTYDCVVSAAAFVPNHIPSTAIMDLVRLTKKGGYIVLAMRTEWSGAPDYSVSVRSVIESLEREGKFEKVKEQLYNHYFQHEGTCYTFRVL